MRLIDADEIMYGRFATALKEDIESMPTIDAAPVVHGHWVLIETGYGLKQCRCSRCTDDEYWQRYYCYGNENYCPNCGAKMDGGANNE